MTVHSISNAKNAKSSSAAVRVMAMGKPGSGKTTQFLTLPGRKFAYLFDPNSLQSLQGFDLDYEEFLPEDIKLGLTSLKKELAEKERIKNKRDKHAGSELYRDWEADYEDKLASGFFNQYDSIMFDSFTTLSDMVMDGIMSINGRAGQWPNVDDYGPQMLALTKIIRSLTSMGKNVYVTAHTKMVQDEVTKKIVNEPLMTGQLKSKLPLLFSELLVFSAAGDTKGNVNFLVQTRPDRYNETCRASLRKCNMFEDVTIDWDEAEKKGSAEGQGLGLLYKDNFKIGKEEEGGKNSE